MVSLEQYTENQCEKSNQEKLVSFADISFPFYMAWNIDTANDVPVEMISHSKCMYFNPESEQMKKHCQVMLYSSCSSFQIFHILYKSLNLPA